MKIKKPSTIFVGSMSDIFGEWIETEWIEQILEVVKKCTQHKFLFLTKNPIRYKYFQSNMGAYENCWFGYTQTSGYSEQFLEIYDVFDVNHYYISAEPLLGNVLLLGNESWIIIGALNKNGKPCVTKKEWVLSLLKQADSFKIPVFIKDSLYELYPELPKRREVPYLLQGNVDRILRDFE